MRGSLKLACRVGCTMTIVVAMSASIGRAQITPRGGVLPTAADGRSLNLDFETGTLADWTATGDAFAGQPIEGDTVVRRRAPMQSRHEGKFWIGGYEKLKDKPTGTLTSAPFKVTQPWCSFLMAGGETTGTRVDLVLREDDKVVWTGSGRQVEDLEPVVVDLRPYLGKEMFVRLVDEVTGHWGHLNFDDFRLHAEKPNLPPRKVAPSSIAAAGPKPAPAAPVDEFKFNGLSGVEAARAMTVPEGFQVTLCAAEPDVQQPIAMAIDDRGRLWVAEAYSYPIRAKEGEGRDRILIFEDADGDGRFDSRKVFIDKLNLVSGLELGFGGVWVGAAPEFLFISDADGDDVPDSKPIVLLDGWGYQDTHETLNSFIWGPDGWLYGCHGVFTHSKVGKPGTPDENRTPLNAAIWRYHPVRHEFEVFAHGTSNPWGVDFNDRGQCFLTACVIPHLFHVIQNGRYHRQAGSHFNPYTYDDIKTIALHRHWIGGTPHAGNNKSDSAGGGHAHSGAMIYLGGKWPAKYRDQIFMNNIHGARINQDSLAPQGSGYVGDRAPDFLLANDSWSQLVYLTYGPDGDIYMIDWYDRQQCHLREMDKHDRSNGRIFKVTYGKPTLTKVDLQKLTDLELVELQLNENDWYVRHARRILQERYAKNGKIDEAARKRLTELASSHPDDTRRLRALWALHVYAGVGESRLIERMTGDVSPYVRGWCIQLLCEGGTPPARLFDELYERAQNDSSPIVRLYLASAALRSYSASLGAIVQHADDASDHNLPLMYWYALEKQFESDGRYAFDIADDSKIPQLRRYVVRRAGESGNPEVINRSVVTIGKNPDEFAPLLTEAIAGMRGVRLKHVPEKWSDVYLKILSYGNEETASLATVLALAFGDPTAIDSLTSTMLDAKANERSRITAIQSLAQARVPGLAPKLQGLLADEDVRAPAVRALAAYDDPKTPAAVLGVYAALSPAEKRDAVATLSGRLPYAQALLDAVEAKTVASADLSADLVRQLRNLKNPALDKRIQEVWGTLNDTPEERLKQITSFRKMLNSPPAKRPDVAHGRAIFVKTCSQCHTLFGAGGKIGPEITGANRTNLDYVLTNILDPSALIGKDYIAHVVETADGRVLTGLVRNETPQALTLVTATETVVLPKSEIENRAPSTKSMMPEDILKPLTEDDVRSLVAYLASPSQVPLAATADNAKLLFNGKDLAGWTGDPSLWSVENGEIVGRAPNGLKKNEFLVSDMTAGDFRLSMDVKLVDDQGNSGVQFRSEAQPGGGVKGYQADVGIGWWGKLYEEHGRALLWPESGERHVRAGEWNRYEIVAVGSRIRTYLNGKLCVELADPDGAKTGIFALQLHSGGPTEVRFRKLQLEVDPQWDFKLSADR